MAELASEHGLSPITVQLTAAAVARGLRLSLQANGLCSVADNTVRGDFITLQDIPASGFGLAQPMASGAVAALSSEACAVGDAAYATTGGKTSKTSTGAAVVGRHTQASNNTLGIVELLPVL